MGTLWRTTFLLLVQGLQSMWTGARAKNRSCVSYGSSTLTEGMEHLRGLILEDGRNGTIQCPHNQCCFGVWNVIQGQLQAQLKGCWISEKKATCDSPTCEPRYSEDELTLSCRCRADMCNDNIRHDGKRSADSMQSSTGIIWIISVCSALFFLGFFAFLVVLRLWKGPALPMRPQETGELTNITTGSERYSERKLPKQELLDLQFHKVLHEGQCSKVWQGTFGQHPVAIKTFPPPCYREFASEWAVHSLPLMSHDNVVRLVAAGCGGPDKEQGGLLVLTLYPLAGTPRYTAPEILDESLNLQDSGSALRQADVYSMALVLWETLMRCSILFPESSTPEFQLAYEAELGSNPTYNELRRLAVEERGRPAIPPSWRRMGQVSVCLQELLEDCWDPEPEARLQAQCAQDRLQMLGAADVTKECC
ncbi:anti-Muellerian hormone type-2 receptor isoform X4 [Heteronotia binoei]|uniref:anti-Muellerian hormone type-2 receptor isoform X4 n=1 Tax=Heteronotia binoei TaxID=13085 RepID=UPI00292E2DA3|nr:anti-Muellerian hormone type-2 receptor isoform X4 [Heteronotia binoei]